LLDRSRSRTWIPFGLPKLQFREDCVPTPLRVALLDTKVNNPNYYMVKSIRQALARQANVQVELLNYFDAVKRARSTSYDILLAVDGEGMNLSIVSRLKQLVGATILWVWEDPYERPVNVETASLFDLVFTNDPGSVGFYREEARHMPLAAAVKLPVRTADADYDYDLFFAGSAWPNRVVALRQLMRTMPHLRSRIVLQYNPGVPKAYLELPDSDYVGSISHDDFLSLANRSRVTLTLQRSFSGDGQKRTAKGPGPRLFEIALAGGYQVVEDSGIETSSYFSVGKELATFVDPMQMASAIDAAIKNPERRIAMARAAQVRAETEHTYDVRIKEMLRIFLARRGSITKTPAPEGVSETKPCVLFVTHNAVSYGSFGGVEVYQQILAKEICNEYNVLFFLPDNPPVNRGMRQYILTDDKYKVISSYLVSDYGMYLALRHPMLEKVLAEVVDSYNVDLIHFHHLINHCGSLPLISRMLGVPSIFTYQDFWTACTRFNLVDQNGLYCNIAERPHTICDVCLLKSEGKHPGSQSLRREFFAEVLQSFDRTIANTPSTIDICRGIYPELPPEKFSTLGLPVPHPSTRLKDVESRTKAVDTEVQPLRAVFLGNFTRHKGAETFLETAAAMRNDNVVFTVCGAVFIAEQETKALPNVVVEGGFEPGELDLTRFDVSLHLSIWPETYCITLSEAWQAGLAPIVTACGALSDRVTDGVDGFQIPIGGAGELMVILRRLCNPRELARIKANIGPHLWLTPTQHAASLTSVYAELIASSPQSPRSALPRVDTGSPTTLALTPFNVYPLEWTQKTIGPPIPMLGVDLAELNPRWEDEQRIRKALDRGLVEVDSTVQAHVDVFGRGVQALESWTEQATEKGPVVQLEGWLLQADQSRRDVLLAARSVGGDIILRGLSYSDGRPDVVAAMSNINAVGFLSEPFLNDMFEPGLYVLELVSVTSNGKLSLVPLPAYVIQGQQTIFLKSPDRIVMPTPGKFQCRAPRAPERAHEYHVDVLKVVDVAPKGSAPLWRLQVDGWLIGNRVAMENIVLQFEGPDDCFAGLGPVARPDVASAFGFEAAVNSGFTGSFWLSGLRPGEYQAKIISRTSAYEIETAIFTMKILDGSKTPMLTPSIAKKARPGS
jgi:glycosyltransferase involved in cell wall biosynthesis